MGTFRLDRVFLSAPLQRDIIPRPISRSCKRCTTCLTLAKRRLTSPKLPQTVWQGRCSFPEHLSIPLTLLQRFDNPQRSPRCLVVNVPGMVMAMAAVLVRAINKALAGMFRYWVDMSERIIFNITRVLIIRV